MNEAELIEELAERTGSSNEEARGGARAGRGRGAQGRGGGPVPGFGKFYAQEREAREGTNPQTKRRVHIPALKVPKFKAGNGPKRAV